MHKYYIPCYYYKLISSETSLKWCKLQEKLKSTNIDISQLSVKKINKMLNDISI